AVFGFAVADKSSARCFQRLGATGIASAYIASRGLLRDAGRSTLRICRATVTARWPARAAAHQHGPPPQAVFHYPDPGEWTSQMVDRPHPVEPLRIGSTCRALIECVGDTDRLQWLDGDPRERLAAIHAIAAQPQRYPVDESDGDRNDVREDIEEVDRQDGSYVRALASGHDREQGDHSEDQVTADRAREAHRVDRSARLQ